MLMLKLDPQCLTVTPIWRQGPHWVMKLNWVRVGLIQSGVLDEDTDMQRPRSCENGGRRQQAKESPQETGPAGTLILDF